MLRFGYTMHAFDPPAVPSVDVYRGLVPPRTRPPGAQQGGVCGTDPNDEQCYGEDGKAPVPAPPSDPKPKAKPKPKPKEDDENGKGKNTGSEVRKNVDKAVSAELPYADNVDRYANDHYQQMIYYSNEASESDGILDKLKNYGLAFWEYSKYEATTFVPRKYSQVVVTAATIAVTRGGKGAAEEPPTNVNKTGGDAKPVTNAPETLNLSERLYSATQRKGNFGIGNATSEQASAMGEAWVGPDYIRKSGGLLISKNGLRQYRPPTFKKNLQKYQANYELRYKPDGEWQSNAHLDIIDN